MADVRRPLLHVPARQRRRTTRARSCCSGPTTRQPVRAVLPPVRQPDGRQPSLHPAAEPPAVRRAPAPDRATRTTSPGASACSGTCSRPPRTRFGARTCRASPGRRGHHSPRRPRRREQAEQQPGRRRAAQGRASSTSTRTSLRHSSGSRTTRSSAARSAPSSSTPRHFRARAEAFERRLHGPEPVARPDRRAAGDWRLPAPPPTHRVVAVRHRLARQRRRVALPPDRRHPRGPRRDPRGPRRVPRRRRRDGELRPADSPPRRHGAWLRGTRAAQATSTGATTSSSTPPCGASETSAGGQDGHLLGRDGELGYSLCMLRTVQLNGHYRDPILLQVWLSSGVRTQRGTHGSPAT